jgi:hypothetical protein
MNGTKKNKTIVISARLTEDEYADITLRISGADGKAMMKQSEYFKSALLDAAVHVKDKEVEQFKVFILSKISNNINQVAHRLNSDNKAGIIDAETYKDVLENMEKICNEVAKLSSPLG